MGNIKELEVTIGDGEYRISSDDNYLNHIKDGFEPDMVKLFETLIDDSEVTLDIGANIGCTAILFSNFSRYVYAFEPSPTTFKFLEKNVLNSEKKNISLQNIALGKENTDSTITFSPSNRSGGFISNKIQASSGHQVEKIKIKKLDGLIDSLGINKVDFVKIDVEGFEKDVIDGAKETLQLHKPLLVLELNHWCLNAFQRISIPDFFDFLRSNFPILLAVDGSTYMDLHNESDSYVIMYHHILNMRFPNIIAAYDENQVDKFKSVYSHGLSA